MYYSVRRWFVNIIVLGTVAFPLLLAVVCALPCFWGGWSFVWDGHDYDFYFLPHISGHLFGGGLCFLLLIFMFVILCRMYCTHPKVAGAVGMFLTALVLRIVIVVALGSMVSPISDFAQSWERACRGAVLVASDRSHLFCPAWLNYSMFQCLLVNIFGKHFIVVLVANAVFGAATATMIYYIALMLFRCWRVATISALLYACYPPSLAYILTATPEHIGIACFAVVAASFIAYMTKPICISTACLISLVVGMVAGVGNSVKPILPIFFTAMLICVIVDVVICTDNRIRQIQKHLIVFGCFIVAQICTSSLILSCTESCFRIDLTNVNPTPHYICVGLNREGEGQIHLGSISRQWASRVASGVSHDRATTEVTRLIIDDWRGNLNKIIPFFFKKMVWAWQADDVPFTYAIIQVGPVVAKKLGVNKNEFLPKSSCICRPEASQRVKWMDVIRQSIQTGAFIWYFVTMLFGVVGVAWYVRTHLVDWHYAFVCLLILGYFCLIVLSEAQSRYKCLIMPYVFVLIAPFVTKCITPRSKDY